ncbi:hypothetical protein Tco_0282355 [Tanacetum coccineum]
MKKMRTVAGDDAIIIGDDVRIVKRRRQDCKETASGLFKRLLQRIRRPSHEGYRNTIELPDGNNLVPLRFDTIRRMRLCLFLFSFRDMPALDLKRRASIGSSFLGGFLLPFPGQFVPTEAHLAPKSPTQVKKITSSCEICSGPHDTQYCMENHEQAFVNYASSRNNEVGALQNGCFPPTPSSYQTKLERMLSDFDSHQEKRLSSLGTQLKQQQDDVINKINTLWNVIYEKFDNTPAHNTAGDFMARVNANRNCSSPKRVHFFKTITILKKEDEPKEERIVEPNEAKDNDHIAIAEMKEKVGGDEPRVIK